MFDPDEDDEDDIDVPVVFRHVATRTNAQMSTKFNAAFWKWFGDSKVVDSKGKPLVVWHGTNSDFLRSPKPVFDLNFCQIGCHFGTMAQASSKVETEDGLFPFYLSIQKPLMVPDIANWTWRHIFTELPSIMQKIKTPRIESDEWIRNQLLRLGYDGIVYLNRVEGLSRSDKEKIQDDPEFWMAGASDAEFRRRFASARDSWIAFKPTQIKSATGNDGTWDEDDRDIRSNPDVFWGNTAAGILFFCAKKKEFLLGQRSEQVQEPLTWGVFGGACDTEEFSDGRRVEIPPAKLFECAVGEVNEELSYFPEEYEVVEKVEYKKNNFSYTTFVLAIPPEEKKAMEKHIRLNWENNATAWKTADAWLKKSDIHFGARYALEELTRG